MSWKHPFEYQAPNAGMVADITRVREACKPLYDLLQELNEKNNRGIIKDPTHKTYQVSSAQAREYFIDAIKTLEQTSMWANKAIVFSAGYAEAPKHE